MMSSFTKSCLMVLSDMYHLEDLVYTYRLTCWGHWIIWWVGFSAHENCCFDLYFTWYSLKFVTPKIVFIVGYSKIWNMILNSLNLYAKICMKPAIVHFQISNWSSFFGSIKQSSKFAVLRNRFDYQKLL